MNLYKETKFLLDHGFRLSEKHTIDREIVAQFFRNQDLSPGTMIVLIRPINPRLTIQARIMVHQHDAYHTDLLLILDYGKRERFLDLRQYYGQSLEGVVDYVVENQEYLIRLLDNQGTI